jgi:hypothetical protein
MDLSLYSPEDVEMLLLERTGIMHICGGIPLSEAQHGAWKAIYRVHHVSRTQEGGAATRYKLTAHKPAAPKQEPPPEPEQANMVGLEEFRAAMRGIWKDY